MILLLLLVAADAASPTTQSDSSSFSAEQLLNGGGSGNSFLSSDFPTIQQLLPLPIGSSKGGANCPQQKSLVQAFINRYDAYWATGNASLVASLYDNFTVFINHADNSAWYGLQQVTALINATLAAYPILVDLPLYTTSATQNCTYLVKTGYFTLSAPNIISNAVAGLTQALKIQETLVLQKQPAGSKQPYLIISDELY